VEKDVKESKAIPVNRPRRPYVNQIEMHFRKFISQK
jgi:hypothetical protein